jgi:hypothetical protein
MDKTLNDTIDALFRGIVFIILNFVTSAATMLASPGRGCIALVRRLYTHDIQQVRPFVFLFICLLVTVATPTVMGAITAKDDPYTYKIYENGVLQQDGTARKVYNSISEKIETKEMFVLLLCCVVGVSVFHICSRIIGRVVFRTERRRQICEDCLSYVVGTQILLVLFLYLIDGQIGSWVPGPGSDEMMRLLASVTDLFSARDGRSDPLWLIALDALSLLVIAILPIPITRALLRRRREISTGSLPSPAARQFVSISAVFVAVLVVNLISGATIFAAGYTQKEMRRPDPAAYAIQGLECALIKRGTENILTSSVIVTATGKQPWLFSNKDFEIFIGAERTDTDPPADPKWVARAHSDPKRILLRGKIEPRNTSPNDRGQLVEPGRFAAIYLEATLDSEALLFLSNHHHGRRCTVSDANDNIVGALAPLADHRGTP